MTIVERFAPAKINLTLHVTGQRDDGLHLLDSLVMFADVGDVVRVSKAPVSTLIVSGPLANGVPDDAGNLVLKAAELIGVTADIRLEKHLPMAAGMGGGSSDAAACLLALSDLSGVPVPIQTSNTLGADVPVCLVQQTARMSGIGERIAPLNQLPELYAVLVNPRIGVSTPDVFRALPEKNNRPMPDIIPAGLEAREFITWVAKQRNDLEKAAISVQPIIADVLSALSRLDAPLMVRMSGSGASCFALFETYVDAKENAMALQATYPGWWVKPARLS